MSIKVHNPFLSHLTNNQRTIEVNGDSVRECLKHLETQFPKLELLDKDGELHRYIDIFANGEIVYPQELDKPVKDGDEISIILMIEGG